MRKSLICRLSTLMLAFTFFTGCKSVNTRWQAGSEPVAGYGPHAEVTGENISSDCKHHLSKASELKKKLAKPKEGDSFLSLLNLYNDIYVHLDAALNKASLFSQVHPDEKIRSEAEVCEQEANHFITELSLDKDIYEVLKKGEGETLDPESKRVLSLILRDFRRAGVDKDDEVRAKIKELKAELVTIGQEFSKNIRDDRFVIYLDSEKDLAGLPQDYIDAHQPGPDGKIAISTDYPDYIPFMQYAKSDKWRKELRFKFLNRGERNGPVLKSMIEKRDQLAKLLGYRSYADYIVEDKMIGKADKIHEFIAKISALAKKGADKEYKELLAFKKKYDKKAKQVFGHESAYLEQAYKSKKFNYNAQDVRPYYSYERVRDGLLTLTGKLFDIRYSPVPDAKTWHPSVAVYDVFDNKEGKLGRIYLDMHPREGKYKHAAQFSVLSGLNHRQYPEGALVCNFPNPADGIALLEQDQVETMFHEFGHLLHHVFAGKQTWIRNSGVATEWDFVEAPSQLLEEWARSPEVLQTFALHYETNEPIPTELVNKMRSAEEFGKALSARQQMFYAALSVDYFDQDPSSFDILQRLEKVQAAYSYFPYEKGTHFPYSFGHLDGYNAMYYTYMWSLSLAKDLYEPFKQNGIMNVKLARRYRDLVLAPGGSKDAKDLVQDFLGRPFNLNAFEKWLTTESKTLTSR